MMATGKSFEVTEVGTFTPSPVAVDELAAGEVGFVVAGIKNVRDTHVGDTITDEEQPAEAPLPGYRRINPMVYLRDLPD